MLTIKHYNFALKGEQMLKRASLLCVVLPPLIGCATTPRPALNLPTNSTAGIINLIDTEATHTHFGTTAFNNFEKKYPVSWNFPEKIEQELTNQIKSSTGLNVLSIQPSKKISENESELIDTKWKLKINSELIPEVKNIMQQNKVDVLLIIRDYKGEDYFTDAAEYEPFRLGHEMKVISLDMEDGLYGVIMKVREGRRVGSVPLCDVEVIDKEDPNYWPVREYVVWFANQ
jgi:hypothetical protein